MKRSFLTLCILALALVCTLCLWPNAQAASTNDLGFILNSDGQGYTVSHCNTSAGGSLTIPATYNGKPITSIGHSAFYFCYSLTSVTIPDSVTTIGSYAFYGCDSLTTVTIPNSVTTIGSYAFYGCESLPTVTIPDSVTSIGSYAFKYCKDLPSVTIGNQISRIGYEAFAYCNDLKTVIIGANVKIIDSGAFDGCFNLESIIFLGNAPTVVGGSAFKETWPIIFVPMNNSTWNSASRSIIENGFLGANGECGYIKAWYGYFPDGMFVEAADQIATEGTVAVFRVDAVEDGFTYQWQYSKNDGVSWYSTSFDGSNTESLSVPATTARNGFLYRCKVTDPYGNVYLSQPAQLTVEESENIKFTSHPAAETVKLGNRAAFTVAADGEVASYQWQYQMVENGPWWNCTQYTQGYNTTELNVIAAEMRQGFLYRCRITDTYGNKYYSNTAELTVDIPESYAILSQPKTTYVMAGKTTTFHIDTQGEGLTYQWEYHKGVDKSGPEYYWIAMGSTTGCKTDTLTIAGISGSINRDGWAYRCVVTDSNGYIYTTDHAFLYVTTAQIDSQPESVTATAGSNAVFAVETQGEVASYQWQYSKDGGRSWYNSSSATQGYNTDTLTVAATAARNGFTYRCKITDSEGNLLITEPAQLTVE